MNFKKILLLSSILSTSLIQNVRGLQPLYNQDGIFIQHRGFEELISTGNKTLLETQATLATVEKTVEEAHETIASLRSMLTTSDFIRSTGIVAIGTTLCIGAAFCCYQGYKDILNGYFPKESKKDKRKRYILQQQSLQNSKGSKNQSQPTEIPSGGTTYQKKKIDEYIFKAKEHKRQYLTQGAIKLVSGVVLFGLGGYAMFRPSNVASFFSAK